MAYSRATYNKFRIYAKSKYMKLSYKEMLQAWKNTKKELSEKDILSVIEENGSITCFFNWWDSPEGYKYWESIRMRTLGV